MSAAPDLSSPGQTLHLAPRDRLTPMVLGGTVVAGLAVVAVRDPNASGSYTPMMMAAREGHDGTALLLIAHGADRLRKNSEGLTAVQLAERAGKPRVARALERGG